MANPSCVLERPAAPARKQPNGCIAALLATTALVAVAALLPDAARAQDAFWLTPASNDFNTATNWTPATVPIGTAFFVGTPPITDLSFSANTSIGGWTFLAGASTNYTFTNNQQLQFNGAGIVIVGGSAAISNNFGGILLFQGSSTAGSATINNSSILGFFNASTAGSAIITNSLFASLNFNDNSTAANAIIINNGPLNFNGNSTAGNATINNSAGSLNFNGTSTAGSATITNSATLNFNGFSTAGSATITNSATLNFNGFSTAGDATVTNIATLNFNNGSTAGSATITNDPGGTLSFNGTSTAGAATIVNSVIVDFFDSSTAGSATITNGGSLTFRNTSTAGDATITNSIGGQLNFRNNSTAGNATIINSGGPNEGVIFIDNSTGGNAALTNNSGAFTDFSFSTGPAGDNRLSVGSLAGAGVFELGANELTVGGNNLSTNVSGVITGSGSLVKVGTGTLTLSGTNTYTGATNVNAGTLSVTGSIGSTGTPSGAIGVLAGATLNVGAAGAINIGTNNLTNAGTVTVQTGGTLNNGAGFVGNLPGSQGTVSVSGAGSTWTNTGTLVVGGLGTGTLTIQDGGVVNSGGGGSVGQSAGSTGMVTVTGPGSSWINGPSGGLNIGSFGTGTLTVANGGMVINNTAFAANIGQAASSTGMATVTGAGSTWSNSSGVNIGNLGKGTLTIADSGVVNGPVTIATNPGAIGTLNIGAGAGNPAAAPGTLTAPSLAFGAGTGTLNFNHTSANYVFAPTISGNGTVNVLAGTTIFTAANAYTGGTTISAGTLQLGNGGASGSITGNVVDNGTLAINRSDVFTFGGVISGTGSFAQIGPGTTILTAANTYSGGTAINGGVLAVAADANLGAATGGLAFDGGTLQFLSGFTTNRAITLNAGGGTVDTNGTNATLAGAIGGTGGLTKISAGTLTLTGNNGYQGGTALNAGTLAVGSNGALGTGALTFASGTALQAAAAGLSVGNAMTLNGTSTVDTQANALTLSGVLSGTGGLTKVGAGTLSLTNANTYSGGTTLAAGTLRLENNQALGSGALTTTGSVADYANSITIANPIVVNSNTTQLQVTTGSATQAGVISELSGPRPVDKIGAGTLVLTSANTYTGPTTISAGTLQLGNGGTSGSILGNVVNNGTFAINRADTFTLGNVISGTGAFQQNGTGATVLTAFNTYSGPTAVNAGALIVNGSIASSSLTTVNSGAALIGSGTVGSTVVNAGGFLVPGPVGVPGTMTVAGNLAFQPGAFYIVQVNPTTASTTNVSGTASLAGTVAAIFAPGSYLSRSYTILTADGGRTGTFDALTTFGLPAGFGTRVNYTGNTALLNLKAQLVPEPIPPTPIPPTPIPPTTTPTPPTLPVVPPTPIPPVPGLPALPEQPSAPPPTFTVNQLNVGHAIDNFFNNGGALPPAFVPLFGLTGGNLTYALDQLSGEAATGAQKVAFQLSDQFLNLMLDPFVDGRSGVGGADHPALGFAPERKTMSPHMADAYAAVLKAPPKAAPVYEPRWTMWGGAYGGSNRTSGDLAVIGSHDLSASTAGFAGGFDYRLTPDSVVGLALAGAGANWSLSQGLGGGKSDAFQAGIYGATKSGPAYLAAAFAFANHWMSTDRVAVGDHLTAKFNAQSYGGRLEGGYRFATPYVGITPYAAIQAQSFHTPGYNETGAIPNGFALTFNDRSATDTRSELGARFDRVLAVNSNSVLALRGRVAWAHDWVSDPTLTPVFQALPGSSFIVNGATPAENSVLASAGVELRLANGVTLLAKFDGDFASHSSTYAGTGAIRYRW